MPTADNNGVKLHFEYIGDGPAVVLQHGFTSSLERWHLSGVVDALRNRYQLILLDARGHGKSDKPHSPSDYSWEKRASDIIAVADEVGIDQFAFWGYSMGAMYAYWVSHYYPDRVNKLIIGGKDPYGTELDIFRNMDANNPDLFIEQFEIGLETKFPPATKARMLENDLYALSAAMNSPSNSVSMGDLPRNIRCECLIYCAIDDERFEGARASSEEIGTSTFVALPNMNHLEAAINNDEILPHVVHFLSE